MDIRDIKNMKLKEKRPGNKTREALAAATGIAIGVGVTAVTLKALANKKNRDKVKKTLTEARSQVSGSIDSFLKDKKNEKKAVKKVIAKPKKKLAKALKPR